MISSIVREIQFALARSASLYDAFKLLVTTAHFHLANRGILSNKCKRLSLNIYIGDQAHRLQIRTGKIGDLFVLYEVLSFDVYAISPKLLAPDKVEVIVDCGANIGLTSLYYAATFPAATIYSVEADPENFALLLSNTKSIPRIIPIQGCVVSKPKRFVEFQNYGPAWGRKLATSGNIEDHINVPGIVIDTLLAQHSIARVDLLKLDIEGAEREVLQSGNYLDVTQNVIIELHDDYRFSEFSATVATHGLRARTPSEECKMVTAYRPKAE